MTAKDELAQKAYKAWVKEMDFNWRHNHPKWKDLNPHAQKTWRVAAAVFKELLG